MASPSSPGTAPGPFRTKVEVAVLGGGFAGVYCGQRLARNLKKAGVAPHDAVIVSEQNYMVFQPMLAEVAGASIAPRHVINPIRRLCRGLRVLRGRVRHIDLEKREVHVDTGFFSAGMIIEWNHLVLALGAEIDLSRVPGMPEHAFVMQNVGDAMILRATLISRLEEANAEQRVEVRRRLLTVVVVGGGFSGVETAGEILDLLHEAAGEYRDVPREEIRVVLVHSRERILHTLDPDLGDYAARKLRRRGLEIRLEERVRACTSTRVYLQSGEVIETATVVSTVGNAPHSVIRGLCDASPVEHQGYRLVTDEFLRVKGVDSVWAAGDCAVVPLAGKPGQSCPATAQFATRQGHALARNLGATLSGRPLYPFQFQGLGELASIGHRSAVASLFGLKFSGFLAWFLWRSIYLSKLPGLDRKLRVMIDWSLDLFFPRDITLLNPRFTKLYRQVHLEPDDTLFNRGEPAFSLYVVQEGGIELHDAEGKVVRRIDEGEYFGERALVHGGGYLYDATATGPTELVSLSGEVVLPFFRSSSRFRRVLGRTTIQGSAEAEIESVKARLDPAVLRRPVRERMRSDVASLPSDASVGDAIALFREKRHSIYPIVSPDGTLDGALAREDLFDYLKRADVTLETPLAGIERFPLPVCPVDGEIDEAVEDMIRSGRQKCLVTDAAGRLVGILSVMDLLGDGGAA
ncbi:MAG: FAD-dependent oxidoreductase [Verrucomicrobiaceae bacterium]|nr:FAD-dependent oxidoreductase [Verrucomicrobiaceae bacterium]